MFTGGIGSFAYNVNPYTGLQRLGTQTTKTPSIGQADFLGINSFGDKPFSVKSNASGDGNQDWFGMFQTMLAPLFEQFGIQMPGVSSAESESTSDDDEDDADKKWKNILAASARVQDNVEAVKVSPPDDSGYYSSLSCYSDS